MLSSLLVVSLLAASPGEHKPVYLASPGLASSGVTADEASALTEHLDRQLARQGVEVQSAASMQRALPPEKWRQLFECDWRQPSCVAQYGEALGVNGVIAGEVSRGQAGYAARLRVLSVKDGSALADEYVTGFGMPELQAAITRLAPRLADQLALKLDTRLDRPTSSRVWALAPLGVGIGVSAAGALLLINAEQKRDFISAGFPDGPETPLDALNQREKGQREQLWGSVLVGVGVAAIVGSVVLYKIQESNTPRNLLSSVSVGPSGIVVSGVFP